MLSLAMATWDYARLFYGYPVMCSRVPCLTGVGMGATTETRLHFYPAGGTLAVRGVAPGRDEDLSQ